METKNFAKNDSGFVCGNCGRQVSPLGYTSRNHCPFCLYSRHLDVNPGDRASDCGGLMRPVAVTSHPKKGFVITHQCTLCGSKRNNKMQSDDDTALLIKLTNPYFAEEYK